MTTYKYQYHGSEPFVGADGKQIPVIVPLKPGFVLQKRGPQIDVAITHPKAVADAMQETGASVLTKHVRALIDTGAWLTTISNALAQELKLMQTGRKVRLISVHDQQERPTYFADIYFQGGAIRTVAAVACSLEVEGIDCLIGRDIMMNWIMTYNGREGSITISDE